MTRHGGTGARSARALHARTVPLDYGPDALEFDGSPTVLFDRPGLTLVGWGTALLVPAAEAAAALAAIPCDDEVGTLGSGPVALGALPFHDTFGGHLVVPRFTMGTSRDADGVTRRWATAVGPADVALPDHRRALRRRHLAVRHDARHTGHGRGRGRPGRPLHPDDRRRLRSHGQGRRRPHGRARFHPAQGGAVAADPRCACAASSPCRPSCAGCGPASPTAPSSPCPCPTAPSSAPAPSSSWPGTAPGCRATPWPEPCRGARPPGPTPTPSAAWPGRPRTGPSIATSSRTLPPPWPRSARSCRSRPSPRWWPSARWPIWGPGSRGS